MLLAKCFRDKGGLIMCVFYESVLLVIGSFSHQLIFDSISFNFVFRNKFKRILLVLLWNLLKATLLFLYDIFTLYRKTVFCIDFLITELKIKSDILFSQNPLLFTNISPANFTPDLAARDFKMTVLYLVCSNKNIQCKQNYSWIVYCSDMS